MSLTIFITVLIRLLSSINALNKPKTLQCTVDESQLHNILSDIEALGYQTQKAFILSQQDAGNNLAPNTGGGYANYIRSFSNNSLPYVYKMDASTAILFHGCTPPISQYFGYSSLLYIDNKIWIWADLGDVLNNRVINTYKQFNSTPFDDLTTIITTADLQTYTDITEVYNNYSITESMINLNPIPFDLVNKMGTMDDSSSFHTFLRVSIPNNNTELQYYLNNTNSSQISNLYFITKDNDTNQFQPNEPIFKQEKRMRICYNSSYTFKQEYQLEYKFHQLLNNVTLEMEKNYRFINRSIKIYGTEYDGYECIENEELCVATTPDALYYEDYNNQSAFIYDNNGSRIGLNANISGYILRDDNMFMIMGINHYNLGLTAYNQETIYDETLSPLRNVNATLNNFQYNNSANYLEQITFGNVENIFYSIMYTRPGKCVKKLVEKGVICVEIGYDDLHSNKGFVVFSRAYLNPCTNTGPSTNQFMYEMLMEFNYIPLNEVIDDQFALIVGVTIAAVLTYILLMFLCMYLINMRNKDRGHYQQKSYSSNQCYDEINLTERE